jgi:cytoskeletal protein CcmA (bactofilin family)
MNSGSSLSGAGFGSQSGASGQGSGVGRSADWNVSEGEPQREGWREVSLRGQPGRTADTRATTNQLPTTIGAGARIDGELELKGGAFVDCHVEGKIVSDGDLIIGESGVIHAPISGQRVTVLGVVRGDISCSEKLELHAGACVTGNLETPSLIIHDGVVFEGSCRMWRPESKLFGAERQSSSSSSGASSSDQLEEERQASS